jgi:hypothetical protein
VQARFALVVCVVMLDRHQKTAAFSGGWGLDLQGC